MPTRSLDEGFTLIEVVVASIIFFLAVAVLSQISGLSAKRVEGLKKEIERAQAVLNSVSDALTGELEFNPVRVVIDGNETEVDIACVSGEEFGTIYLPEVRGTGTGRAADRGS